MYIHRFIDAYAIVTHIQKEHFAMFLFVTTL